MKRDTRDTEVEAGHLGYLLTAYAFESISVAGRREVEGHLSACAECREELAGIRGTVATVRDAYVEEKARSYSFEKRRIQRVLAAGRTRRRGRFAFFAVPIGAAAAVLVGFLFLGTISTRGRGRSGRGPVEEVAAVKAAPGFIVIEEQHADTDGARRYYSEDGAYMAGRPGGAGGTTAGGVAALPTAPSSGLPPPPAAEPAQAPAPPPGPSAPAKPSAEVARGDARSNERHRDSFFRWGTNSSAAARDGADRLDESLAQGQAQSTEHFEAPSRRAVILGRSDHLGYGGLAAGEKLDASGVKEGADGDRPEVQNFSDFSIELKKKDAEREKATESPDFQPPVLAYDAAGSAGKGVQSDGLVPTPEESDRVAQTDLHLFSKSRLESRVQTVEQLKEVRDFDRLADVVPGEDGVQAALDDVALLSKEPEVAASIQGWSITVVPGQVLSEFGNVQELEPGLDATRYARQPGQKPEANAAAPTDLASRGSRERVLRAWSHWKGLDQGLSLEGFEAKRLVVPPPSPAGEGLTPEEFRARYGVNPFVDTRLDPLSTFGMDVDTASYTIARGALAAGRLPEPQQVRVEEFVNYFPEELPSSKDSVFSVACEGGPSPFGAGLDLLKVAIRAREILPGERKDAVLTLAVDTSGSMHHGGRLALVREALGSLVQALEPGDRVAVVGFGDHPYLVLPHTSAREAERILDALGSLTPRGDTNFEAGLDLAYRVADEALEPKAVNRIILCSDGVATTGARGPEDVLGKVEAYARRGVHLSCLGVGLGKYNDRLLETLADRGNGNYAYADDAPAAAEVFRKNLPATLQVLARDAKIQAVFNPEVVGRYRLLGYENRDIADKDFRNDKVDAGEVGPGATVTVLYEIERRSGSSGDLGRIHLRYVDTGTERVMEMDYPLPPGVMATRLEDTSDRFRFIASAAEMAELLRGSYWARNGSFWDVLRVLARLGPEHRARPEVRELMGLAIRAQSLTLSRLEGK